MTHWKQVLLHLATDAEGHFDTLYERLRQRMGWSRPAQIVPYLGYGTSQEVYLKGRVIEDKGITSAMDNDTIWLNLLNMYKRYNSQEIGGARVRAQHNGVTYEAVTDRDGFFEFRLPPPATPTDHLWQDIPLELVSYPADPQPEGIRATGQVLVPPPTAQFGIVSDIDDTVLQTNVAHVLKMARNVFLNNSRTRLPFEGVAAFYQALQKGTKGGPNPLFYLSSSPWNLYDLLVDFFAVRGIPIGPLFLIDLGLTENYFISPSHQKHKLSHIQQLLAAYPDLPFILIGDSGQKDPEIYLQAALEHPGRILAIYIRDVSGDLRDRQIAEFQQRAEQAGTDLLLVKDTAAASLHATQKGYILAEALADISQERQQDQQAPNSPLEKLLDPESV